MPLPLVCRNAVRRSLGMIDEMDEMDMEGERERDQGILLCSLSLLTSILYSPVHLSLCLFFASCMTSTQRRRKGVVSASSSASSSSSSPSSPPAPSSPSTSLTISTCLKYTLAFSLSAFYLFRAIKGYHSLSNPLPPSNPKHYADPQQQNNKKKVVEFSGQQQQQQQQTTTKARPVASERIDRATVEYRRGRIRDAFKVSERTPLYKVKLKWI